MLSGGRRKRGAELRTVLVMTSAPPFLARAAAATAAAALMTAGLAGVAASPASAVSGYVTAWTPGTYTWTVPAGVTQISVKAYGAQGGGVADFGDGVGGHGAESWRRSPSPRVR